jgi:hypothetical protein
MRVIAAEISGGEPPRFARRLAVLQLQLAFLARVPVAHPLHQLDPAGSASVGDSGPSP